MKKFLCLLIICSFLFSCNSQKKGICIGICQISNDPVLDLARENVIKALKDAGYEEGKNITFDYKNAQGEISNIFLILKEFKSKNVELIVTNGTPCMASAVQAIKDIPVVYTVSFSPNQIGIAEPPANLCGVYDPLKMDEVLKIIKESIPGINSIGHAYNPSEPNAQFAAKRLKEECDKAGITLNQSSVSNSNDITSVIQSLANKKVQALVLAADNMLYNGISSVISIANAQKIPLFVTDPQQATKGAVIGFGIAYSDWGYESGKIAVQILKGKKPYEFGNKPLEVETIIYNKKAAKAQGFYLPESLLKRVTSVIE
jgi:putative tryptophan/tyrosine transport system substrate-binding protein